MTKEALKQAAQAVLDRWNSPKWTWEKQGPTADLMANLKEALAQPEERNFCPRCGKRTADLTAIHTCTPPQENT